MQNSKGLSKLQNKLGLKKQANNGDYKVLLDPNTGVAVLVDNEGKFVYFPKPKNTNSPEWEQYQFLVNYNNRLNNPYGENEEGGIPIVFGADILGSQLQRKYIKPGNPAGGSVFTQDDTYSQPIYESNPDNPISLFNVIQNLAFADAEFRGMHYGSNISPHSDPTSVDFSDIFRAHKIGTTARSGLLTHLHQSVVNPEDISIITTHPLHKWYASEIEDDLRLRGYDEHLIAARPTKNFEAIVGRTAESPWDSIIGGYSTMANDFWSWATGEDTDYTKAMRQLIIDAQSMETENRFTRFVPMHQQAAYRTLRELERKGQLNDPFFVNGNMFYIAPTTVNEDGEQLQVWNPNSTFIDLANRKDQELLNIENALGDENALQEAIKAINDTMYEGAPQPTFSSPQAKLLFTVLDNNRQEFYKLDQPKVLEDGRKLLYNIDDMPTAMRYVAPYYRSSANDKSDWTNPLAEVPQMVRDLSSIDSYDDIPAGYIYKSPSLTDFALSLNAGVDDYTDRVFIDSAGRRFVTQSDNAPLYRHTSDNLNPTTDAEAYRAIEGANYGWQNREYGSHPIYGNPYAQLVTGGILESAYLRKRDSDQLLKILGSLGNSNINHGIEITGNRDSTRPTPYLYHYLSYMGFDPSTARVPADGKLFGYQVFDNPGGAYSTDTVLNSDRVRHMRTSDFSHDWESWARDAGKWVQKHTVGTLGGTDQDGRVLGEVTQLAASIFNPQMFLPGLYGSPTAWMDGTGEQQRIVDLDTLGKLIGKDLTTGNNAERILNSNTLSTLNAAYYDPSNPLAGIPQTVLADLSAIPVARLGIKGGVGLVKGTYTLGRRALGKASTPPIQEIVATGPIIEGDMPSALNDLSRAGNLKINQSGAYLVTDGTKPITPRELYSSNAVVRNNYGDYMRAVDFEIAKQNGATMYPFWAPGEPLTLQASPSNIAIASNGVIPASGIRGIGARLIDLYFLGGTLPDTVFNPLRPVISYRGMRYNAARSASRTPWYKYEPFKWEQVFGKSGPKRENTFSYDPETNTLVTGKPVQGLIGIHGGSKWDPRTWGSTLIYDSEGHIRPIISPIIGRNSFSRYNSFTMPHVLTNVDPHLQYNYGQAPGELRNTADYYTPFTYNTVIDEYANNDYINKNKLSRKGQTTSSWPWLAIGGAGLGLGLLLSNRKKEEEKKKKRKRQQYMQRLQYGQEYDPYNGSYYMR